MAVNYAAALKTARMQAVADAIDAGSGPGTLEIATTGFASVLAILTLADPCGTVSGSVLTLDTTPAIEDSAANATGTAAVARIKDSNGNVIVNNLTVGTSATDIVLTSTSITTGQLVQVTSATFTHAT
ncbi:hypothetical protein G3545_14075 [Starkeya sp. ORNL1]|uniref:hypothetical protein n=1 Tax=Starkeya sp. ORNL1 TaxID=2709380 RepID=UPI0014646EC0|nr:hypothetical protein [Starkeya sp. ORNL1]QJP14671.1 hypothetical protein G3545_14075 [Starkeya sp. ORNL1]